MKKVLCIMLLTVMGLALSTPAQAQLFKFGVKGGVNVSKLDLDDIKDNSTGFFVGPMAEITIPLAGLGVDASLLYSQKGDGDFKQQGLDIPINLKYTFGLGSALGIFVTAGPDFYFDFNGDFRYNGQSISRKNAQVGINVGAGLKLLRHLQLAANYNIPLGDSFTWDKIQELDTKNKTWQLSLAYIF